MLEVQLFLLNKDVPHGFDEFVTIISTVLGHIATRVGIVWISSGTKPDPGITGRAVVFIVTHDSNSCLSRIGVHTPDVETLLLAVVLQGSTSDQLHPFVPTQ